MNRERTNQLVQRIQAVVVNDPVVQEYVAEHIKEEFVALREFDRDNENQEMVLATLETHVIQSLLLRAGATMDYSFDRSDS